MKEEHIFTDLAVLRYQCFIDTTSPRKSLIRLIWVFALLPVTVALSNLVLYRLVKVALLECQFYMPQQSPFFATFILSAEISHLFIRTWKFEFTKYLLEVVSMCARVYFCSSPFPPAHNSINLEAWDMGFCSWIYSEASGDTNPIISFARYVHLWIGLQLATCRILLLADWITLPHNCLDPLKSLIGKTCERTVACF